MMGSGAETRSMTAIGMLTAIIVMRKSRPFVGTTVAPICEGEPPPTRQEEAAACVVNIGVYPKKKGMS